MRITPVLLAALSLVVTAPLASADSFHYTFSNEVSVVMSGSTVYTTGVDGPGTTSTVSVAAPGLSTGLLTDPGYFAPLGSTITSATLEFTFFPLTNVQSLSLQAVAGSSLQAPNPNDSTSYAPTFNSYGTVSIGQVTQVDGISGVNDVFYLPAIISGNFVGGGAGIASFSDFGGLINAVIKNQGDNWAGYINATAQAQLGYTVSIDGTYATATSNLVSGTSPVPEPSGLALLGTGVLMMAAFLRFKHLDRV